MKIIYISIFVLLVAATSSAFCVSAKIQTGADQMDLYLPLLKNKRVGVFANATSVTGNKQLVDVLIEHEINVKKIFSPEHGFRNSFDAGEHINDNKDPKTGLPIISLYGKKFKPTSADLQDLDILVFDLQDVGVSFYTYISSLQEFMEAAAENNKPLIILDRPNPNGFYVDGPVHDAHPSFFTELQPIPFVYGMTIGEYAQMLVGEEWLNLHPKSKAKKLKLIIIHCKNYTHDSLYIPPVKPSPNLPDIQSIYWYASLGLLEETKMSVGRGTNKPYQYFGHPSLPLKFTFIPRSRPNAKHPPYENQVCHGWDLSGSKEKVLKMIDKKVQLRFIINAYKLFPNKSDFFYKTKHTTLFGQIESGKTEKEIRESWQPKLNHFKKIRKKYLLYPDFK